LVSGNYSGYWQPTEKRGWRKTKRGEVIKTGEYSPLVKRRKATLPFYRGDELILDEKKPVRETKDSCRCKR